MGDITGTTFAGHEVRDVIGIDLVSTLYRAASPDEDRTVALRVIAQDLCAVDGADRQLYRRFRSEATASLTFEHPHSPTVEEIGEHHGQGYLVAPFVDTVPLSRLAAEHPPLPVDAALELFGQIADVLDSAQASGLTHGAVNPSTVSFGRPGADGRPEAAYLTGYGVGALLELRLKRDRKKLTVTDDLFYVAPEQLRQQPVTGRTDQYALACALVHVLTGEPPFVRDSIGGLFGAHLFVEPEFDPSSTWASAARKAMAKEPDERFDHCAELIEAVRAEASRVGARAVDMTTSAAPITRSATPPSAFKPTEQPQPAEYESQVAEPPTTPPPPDPRPSRSRPQPVAVDPDAGADRVGGTVAFNPSPASSAGESPNGVHPPAFTPDTDAPLLSDVLGQNEAARRGQAMRSPGARLLLLLLGLVIITAIVVWIIGS